jgi:hypothetical protein
VPGHENPLRMKTFGAGNDVVAYPLYDEVLDAA